jgi:plastocyanin
VHARLRQAVPVVGVAIGILLPAALPAAAAVPKQIVNIQSNAACPNATTYCFTPQKATVSPGTKVVWKNLTSAAHDITRCDLTACGIGGGSGTDPGLGSPIVFNGEKYVFTFQGTGKYNYNCSVHGYSVMHGKIVVAQPT